MYAELPEIGMEPRQIAEILVDLPAGDARRGSGYRVGHRAVLTAAHVVAGAESVRVRFDADREGEWVVDARQVLADDRSDVAAIVIDPPPGAPPAVVPAFARVGDVASEIVVEAAGFPRFKLKAYGGRAPEAVYRDLHQATGTVAALSNRRSGSFEVTVRPPASDPDPSRSPWEGMSGAALWSDGRIIGLVTEHHPSDGTGRLAATRVDRLVERAATGGDTSDVAELVAVLGLPRVPRHLPDVGGPPRGLLGTSYRLQIADIAPKQLVGREPELAELATFAGGEESYGWWEAPPWAGKTALAAWFALNPPPDVDVVAFFVASALAGQSDSDAFLEAMSEQLTLLAGQPVGVPVTTSARRHNLLTLLQAAAARCRDAGRRLVLVVDGLDEDTGATTQKPSIASLLPRRLPDGTSVVVTSRPGRPLPLDVPADHPLHRCGRRLLGASREGQDDETFARRELREQLRSGPLQEDLLGLITASGGGLGSGDLAELTQQRPAAVEELLCGRFGHSIGTRVQRLAGSEGSAGEVTGYLLCHRTLHEIAEQEFGSRLHRYRDRLHDWADGYRRSGWPEDTPPYLLRDYPRMLAIVGDSGRLAALAADTGRHDRMLEITGGDALALDEIAVAEAVGLRHGEPDLCAAVRLALRREELTRRNAALPVQLPAVWASMGRLVRAEALARGIPGRGRRDEALAQVAAAAARTGRIAEAELLAAGVGEPARRDDALVDVAVAAAVHDPVRAQRIVEALPRDRRDAALARIAPVVAIADPVMAAAVVADLAVVPDGARARVARALVAVTAGEDDLAESLVDAIPSAHQRTRARVELAVAVARAGRLDRAERIAATVRGSGRRVHLFADLVRCAVTGADGAGVGVGPLLADVRKAAGDAEHKGDAMEALLDLSGVLRRCGREADADALDADAEGLADQMTDAERREWAVARLAVARAAAGDQPGADVLLGRLGDPDRVASALTTIAVDAARDGDPERAEACVRRLPAARRMQALTELAGALVASGRHGRAAVHAVAVERLSRHASDPQRLTALAVRVVEGLCAAGGHRSARRIAALITDPGQRGSALTRVAESLARSGDVTGATEICAVLPGTEQRILVEVAACAAHGAAGRGAEAVSAAIAVSASVHRIHDRHSRVVVLVRLLHTLAAVGAFEEAKDLLGAAEEALDGVSDPGQRVRALVQVALARAAVGESECAAELGGQWEVALADITDPSRQDRARTRVAEALAAAGRVERAAEVGGSITGPAGRVRALAAAAAAAGQGDRAWVLLNRAHADLALVSDPHERGGVMGRLASAAADVLGAGDDADCTCTRHSWLTHMVAELLTSDAWIEAMPVLARLEPRAFDTAVTWLSDRLGGE